MQLRNFIVSCLLLLSSGAERAFAQVEERPFLAIWRESDGMRPGSKTPYLRIAIWNDGRVLFAKKTNEWSHDLLEGRIEKSRIENLKKAVKATGVFELKSNCYLVPDGGQDCLRVEIGKEQQMLYWDEIETQGYGINISPKPQHKKFKQCWKTVNGLALEAIPTEAQPYQKHFDRPPAWILKRPIQSK